MIELVLVFALAVALGWPLGLYLARVMRGDASRLDRIFLPVERLLYRAIGTRADRGMDWKGYAKAFLISNAVVGLVVWVLFMTQAWLPFNPDAIPNMRWDTALHTMVSFLTNTNQQHYSGQAQLSYLSQMVGIVGLQVVTPMIGLALLVATLRGLFGGRNASDSAPSAASLSADGGKSLPVTQHYRASASASAAAGGQRTVDVGNYWVDVTRATLRFMLPLCFVLSLLLTAQGVPSTPGPPSHPSTAAPR